MVQRAVREPFSNLARRPLQSVPAQKQNGRGEQQVVAKCSAQIKVGQVVECPLTAAARTKQTG